MSHPPRSFPDLWSGKMPVLPDHFSGNYQGGNVPPDLDLYSKSVRGDTPGDGRMAGVQSLVPVSFSPRPDDLTMQAHRGGRGFQVCSVSLRMRLHTSKVASPAEN